MLIFKHAKLLAYDMSLQSKVMLNVFNIYCYYDLFDCKLSSGLDCQYKLKKKLLQKYNAVLTLYIKTPEWKFLKNQCIAHSYKT